MRNSLRRIRSGRTRLAGLLFVAAILGVFAVSPAASAETAGPYHFTNRLGLLLAVNGGQMANGNKVVQWSNTGSLDQFWYADYANSDEFRIRNKYTDSVGNKYCLDVPNASTQVGMKVQIWTCNTNRQQLWSWSFDGPTGYGHLINDGTSLYIAVNGGDPVVGRDVIQWSWRDTLDQYWGAA